MHTELPALSRLNAPSGTGSGDGVPIDMLEKVDAESLLRSWLCTKRNLPVYVDRDYSVQRGFVANDCR